ncbi:acyltransferase family protein [Aeromicrobium sp.]|uniref:acyltransferase family protein n=1 Tax=Aeromicrobium sp. TaxID=1871063 RepID=UPI0025BEF4E2|nr:acyltransferase family protein [Aeromicrobium sp.]MCK5891265.1 acyltransferase [Aeromicrobium sp.]
MPSPAPALASAPAPAPAGGGVRPEIQALRAVAVLGVVLYHLWPTRLSGGYVGVDVFFVVSGYLITDHLLREVERSGPPRLVRFWARRARRLLPASFLAIAATAVAVWALVPENRWPQFGRELWTSTLYVQNWELARQAVDYMALSNVKSPTQHFWSLGVEEQFYLVWPVLIALVVLVATRLRRDPVRAIGLTLAAVVVLSLIHSIDLTASDPGRAYFVTTTRAWEFAAGGLLAWAVRRGLVGTLRAGPATALSWAGAAAVLVAMVMFDDRTPFPGYTAALPVVGTLAVIAAGAPRGRLAPTPLMRWRPVQFMGDVSYGVYLWHWPLIILLPYATGHDLTRPERLAILLGSFTLGWASKNFVEDPIRRPGTGAWHGTSSTFLGVAVASLVIVVGTLPLSRWTAPPPPVVGEQIGPCVGATAMLDPDCGSPEDIELLADETAFPGDLPLPSVLECESSNAAATYRRCELGGSDPQGGTALIGDSHATRWAEVLGEVSARHDTRLSTFLVSGCSMATTDPIGSIWGSDPTQADNCATALTDVLAEVVADPSITTVVLSNRTRLYAGSLLLTADRVAATMRALLESGKRVVVLADPPEMSAVPPQAAASAADCLQDAGSPHECSLPRAEAEVPDPMREAAAMVGVPVVDLTDVFCLPDRCLSRIGGLVVYSDDNHLTRSFAASTRDVLDERLATALATA